jgi:hypothetical protein
VIALDGLADCNRLGVLSNAKMAQVYFKFLCHLGKLCRLSGFACSLCWLRRNIELMPGISTKIFS